MGEKTGQLGECFLNIAANLEKSMKIKRYMYLLEPLIILFVALFIELLIMTILPIILNLSDIKF